MLYDAERDLLAIAKFSFLSIMTAV